MRACQAALRPERGGIGDQTRHRRTEDSSYWQKSVRKASSNLTFAETKDQLVGQLQFVMMT